MRYAICNELFGNCELEDQFSMIKAQGFDGVELAPHTIFGDFSGDMGPGIVRIRRALENEGLAFAGLHWLLVGPPGLHASSPDDGEWRRAWDHVARLIDLAGEFGGGAMVFGSPAQRASRGMLPPPRALKRFSDGLASVADRASDANARILLEALGSANTDIMNTLDDVRRVLRDLDHPAIETVFDFHNVDDETLSWEELIRANADIFTHVHLNELDGSPPTIESESIQSFRAAFDALKAVGYERWVSLEIFTVPDDPAATLAGVRQFLTEVAE